MIYTEYQDKVLSRQLHLQGDHFTVVSLDHLKEGFQHSKVLKLQIMSINKKFIARESVRLLLKKSKMRRKLDLKFDQTEFLTFF